MFRIVMLRALLAAALAITIPASTTAQDEATPEGTEWYLVAYDAGGPDLTAVPWDVFAPLTLDDGQAVGSTGCNRFGATYDIDGEQLTFSPRFQTQRACSGAKMEVEAAYMAALLKTARWDAGPSRTRDRELILFDADDEQLLRFSPYDTVLLVRQVQELTAELEVLRTELEALRAGLPVSSSEWGPLAVLPEGTSGDAGLGPGLLSIDTDCVTFRTDRADEVGVTLVWPADTTSWRPKEQRIVMEQRRYGTTRLSDGDRVMVGGVPLSQDTPEETERIRAWLEASWVQAPDPSCPTEELFHVGEVEVLEQP